MHLLSFLQSENQFFDYKRQWRRMLKLSPRAIMIMWVIPPRPSYSSHSLYVRSSFPTSVYKTALDNQLNPEGTWIVKRNKLISSYLRSLFSQNSTRQLEEPWGDIPPRHPPHTKESTLGNTHHPPSVFLLERWIFKVRKAQGKALETDPSYDVPWGK